MQNKIDLPSIVRKIRQTAIDIETRYQAFYI